MTEKVDDMRPYLINAAYRFIADRGETQYLLVRVDNRCAVPQDQVKERSVADGHPPFPSIVFNVSMDATRNLHMPENEDYLSFDGSFNGRKMSVQVPYDCVMAIYSRECPNQAIGFEYIPEQVRRVFRQGEAPVPERTDAPALKVVK